MTKTISIYAAQVLLGAIAIAAGYAKLTGSGLMVHQFQAIGLGTGFLTAAAASYQAGHDAVQVSRTLRECDI